MLQMLVGERGSCDVKSVIRCMMLQCMMLHCMMFMLYIQQRTEVNSITETLQGEDIQLAIIGEQKFH